MYIYTLGGARIDIAFYWVGLQLFVDMSDVFHDMSREIPWIQIVNGDAFRGHCIYMKSIRIYTVKSNSVSFSNNSVSTTFQSRSLSQH